MCDSINAGTVAYYFRSYAIWMAFFSPSVLWIDLSKQPEKTKIDEVIQWRQLILFRDVGPLSICFLLCLFFWMNFHDNGKIVHTSFLSLLKSKMWPKCHLSYCSLYCCCFIKWNIRKTNTHKVGLNSTHSKPTHFYLGLWGDFCTFK